MICRLMDLINIKNSTIKYNPSILPMDNSSSVPNLKNGMNWVTRYFIKHTS